MGVQSSNEKGLGFVVRIVIGVKIDTLSPTPPPHNKLYGHGSSCWRKSDL